MGANIMNKEQFRRFIQSKFGDAASDHGGNDFVIEGGGLFYDITNDPETGNIYVEQYGEIGFADEQLSPTEIEEFAKKIGKANGIEYSKQEAHVHGKRLYLHPQRTVKPSNLSQTLGELEAGYIAISNAIDAVRRERGANPTLDYGRM